MKSEIPQYESLAAALGKRDFYTEAHCGRVESLCLQLGRRCMLDSVELQILQIASRLHDIGKIGIPDYILLKPGRLDKDEIEIMKTHPVIGQEICEKATGKHAVTISLFVRHHHEAFDGSGYPDGLSGDKMPLCSKIILLADSYDAMMTTRPYQRARSHVQVMEIMRSERGSKGDPLLYDQFEQIVASGSYVH